MQIQNYFKIKSNENKTRIIANRKKFENLTKKKKKSEGINKKKPPTKNPPK